MANRYNLCVKPVEVTAKTAGLDVFGLNYNGLEAESEVEACEYVLKSFEFFYGCQGVVVKCVPALDDEDEL